MSGIIEDDSPSNYQIFPYTLLKYAIRSEVLGSSTITIPSSNCLRVISMNSLDGFYQLKTEIRIEHKQVSLRSNLLKNERPFIINSY